MACRRRFPVSSAARRVLAHERRAQKRNSSDEPDCGCHDNVVTERRGSAAASRANLVSGPRIGLIVFPGHQSFQRVELDGMRAVAQRFAQWLLIRAATFRRARGVSDMVFHLEAAVHRIAQITTRPRDLMALWTCFSLRRSHVDLLSSDPGQARAASGPR